MKVLFIHGLASSGAYKTADTLRILLKPCEVIAPDVPIDPEEAFAMLTEICRTEAPDLVVGLSMGGFWAQKLRGFRKILINPDFHISRLMRTMRGEVKYLSPRRDGAVSFVIDDALCDAYEKIETNQFNQLTMEEIALTDGLFGDRDEMVDCSGEFALNYPGRAHVFPGGHLPGFPIIRDYLQPMVARGGEGC